MDYPHIANGDDGSLLCEWITKDVRFSLSVEQDGQVIWVFVSRDFDYCGYLPQEVVDRIKGKDPCHGLSNDE
jgi:hypothetical protein